MKKFVCPICGYVHEGDTPPAECPICHAPGSKFKEMTEKTWAAEHIVGVAKDAPEDIKEGLRMNFNGECSEVGMYLAMARVAIREGYPEIGEFYKQAAWEEAEHACKFAELLEKLSPIPPKRTSNFASTRNSALRRVKSISRKRRKSSVSTRFTTPYTKWLATKLVTVRASKGF